MSNRAVIHASDAPQAIGPYSQGVATGNLLFISGQLPIDPATGAFVSGGIAEHAHQCLKNLSAIAKGWGVDQVAEKIETDGHKAYLVEIGGEIRARGLNMNGKPWQVGVSSPDAQFAIQKIIAVKDVGIATSGHSTEAPVKARRFQRSRSAAHTYTITSSDDAVVRKMSIWVICRSPPNLAAATPR